MATLILDFPDLNCEEERDDIPCFMCTNCNEWQNFPIEDFDSEDDLYEFINDLVWCPKCGARFTKTKRY